MPKAIVIVGVGALGSHLVQFLRNEDVTIKVIDFDRIEARNVLSQFHGKPSVGKMKSNALKQSMQFLFGTKIEAKTNKLAENNVVQLLSGSDLVVDCLDNAASRTLVQDYALQHNVPCLHGALAANGEYGRVVWTEDFNIDDEAGQGVATCENGEFLPFVVLVSAYTARAVQEFLRTGKRVGYAVSPVSGFIF